MRAVQALISPNRGWFGPFHRSTVEADAVSLEALHAMRLLDDGSSVMLYEYVGDRGEAESLAADHFGVDCVGWQVSGLSGRQLMYAHAQPSDMITGLLLLLGKRKVIVDWPVTFVDDSTLSVTLVGDGGEIRALLEAIPDDVRVSLERTGDYRLEVDRLLSRLTPREREILRTAFELGYYRNPREATYDDVSEAVGCSAGTVGHHLRNVEEKLMSNLL